MGQCSNQLNHMAWEERLAFKNSPIASYKGNDTGKHQEPKQSLPRQPFHPGVSPTASEDSSGARSVYSSRISSFVSSTCLPLSLSVIAENCLNLLKTSVCIFSARSIYCCVICCVILSMQYENPTCCGIQNKGCLTAY